MKMHWFSRVGFVFFAAGFAVLMYGCMQRTMSVTRPDPVRNPIIQKRIVKYDRIIRQYAAVNGLSPDLIRRVIAVESSGRPTAVSSAGAKGLMQLMPITIREVQRQRDFVNGDPFDPEFNIRYGSAYLRILMDRFDNDLYMTIAAYHAGPTFIAELCRTDRGLRAESKIRRGAPSKTVEYCRRVLSGHPSRILATTRRSHRR